jgi:hypothetical protein
MPLTSAKVPSGVSAENEKRRPSADRVRGVTVPAAVRLYVALSMGLSLSSDAFGSPTW